MLLLALFPLPEHGLAALAVLQRVLQKKGFRVEETVAHPVLHLAQRAPFFPLAVVRQQHADTPADVVDVVRFQVEVLLVSLQNVSGRKLQAAPGTGLGVQLPHEDGHPVGLRAPVLERLAGFPVPGAARLEKGVVGLTVYELHAAVPKVRTRFTKHELPGAVLDGGAKTLGPAAAVRGAHTVFLGLCDSPHPEHLVVLGGERVRLP